MSDQIQLNTFVVERQRRTPYHGFALMGFAEMLGMGVADLGQGWIVDSDHPAVVARIGEDVVGILTFEGFDACAKVGIAYVLPDYRRRGIFRLMLDELIKWAERNSCRHIEFDVPIQNTAASKTLVATGASAVSQCFRIVV